MSKQNLGTDRNKSELLFEKYLIEHGYTGYHYELRIEGKRKRPDYRLKVNEMTFLFEVKEFDGPLPSVGYGAFNSYKPIREKINQAARQFKEYRDGRYTCSLVLANPNGAFIDFGPHSIFGAMLGDEGFAVKVGAPISDDNPQTIFVNGGKMIDARRCEPQNTTISSIIVLETYPLRQEWIARE